jgi:hypothetical protein
VSGGARGTAVGAAKRVLPPRVRAGLRLEAGVLRERRPAFWARWNHAVADAWVRDRLSRRRYRILSEEEVRAARRSDTVFVFGSGASLNELTDDEWEAIGRHDVFGFNAFYRQQWIRTDFHLLRGGVYGELRWRPHALEVQELVGANPLFDDAIFLLQEDYFGQFANLLAGRGLLPAGAKLLRYRTAVGPGPPGSSLSEIRHAPGTLSDTVNCAYCLGWREIVLVGVDLYDSRYFWLPRDRTLGYDAASGNVVAKEFNTVRGNRYDDPHNTVRGGVVEQMGEWGRLLADEGVQLCVYNPRSLLAERLPVYPRVAAPA